MNETELRDVDFGTYTEEQYFDDMGRLTQYRCDPDMTEILIRRSFETGVWMRGKGCVSSSGSDGRRSGSTASSNSGAGSPAIFGAVARN